MLRSAAAYDEARLPDLEIARSHGNCVLLLGKCQRHVAWYSSLPNLRRCLSSLLLQHLFTLHLSRCTKLFDRRTVSIDSPYHNSSLWTQLWCRNRLCICTACNDAVTVKERQVGCCPQASFQVFPSHPVPIRRNHFSTIHITTKSAYLFFPFIHKLHALFTLCPIPFPLHITIIISS